MQKIRKIIRTVTAFTFMLVMSACANTHEDASNTEPHVGAISTTELFENYSLFADEYERYQASDEALAASASLPNDLVVDIYFGTWCHDSQREVPRVLKLLTHNSQVDIRMVGLDYNKKDPSGLADKAGVKYTPTIVVSRQGKEIGRIIERPKVGLMTDIIQML